MKNSQPGDPAFGSIEPWIVMSSQEKQTELTGGCKHVIAGICCDSGGAGGREIFYFIFPSFFYFSFLFLIGLPCTRPPSYMMRTHGYNFLRHCGPLAARS